MKPCTSCDTHGPEISQGQAELRDFHRAGHQLVRVWLLEPWERILTPAIERLASVLRKTDR